MNRSSTNLPSPVLFAFLLALALVLPSCLNTTPKVLGQNAYNAGATNTSGTTTFKFNFALAQASNSTIYLQGATSTQSSNVGICNYQGSGCTCTFYGSSGNTLGTSSSVTYDYAGNYFRCVTTSAITSSASYVQIQNLSNTVSSGQVQISTLTAGQSNTLTLTQLIGSDLDANRVRYVYRYACAYNYLQKQGTSDLSFDCTSQATLCDSGNFCLLKATFPYYLYADGYGSNIGSAPVDSLYGNGSGSICSLQIKKYDCASPGNPTLKFGLYDTQSGIWQNGVNLPAAPDQPAASYGYAAATSTSTAECPPGLSQEIFYTATIDTTSIVPTSNFSTGLISTEISTPSVTPTNFQVTKYGGGSCTGTSCTLPISAVSGTVINQSYSSTGYTTFCVIPASLLP